MEQANKHYFVSLNFLIVIIFLFDLSLAIEFSYKDESSWPKEYPYCHGRRQSPVSIDYSDLDDKNPELTFSLTNYDTKPSSAKLLNIGHTLRVEFDWGTNKAPYIVGKVLNEAEYVLGSMEIHWSRVDNRGAEHILFNEVGAIEIHNIHYQRQYGSVQNATKFKDGLAIIVMLFYTNLDQRRRRRDSNDDEVELYDSAEKLESPALRRILNNIEAVRTPGSSVDIKPFAASDFHPIQMKKFTYLSYIGSMTIPPCTENVIWLLDTYPYQLTEEKLEYLQSTVEFDNGDDHNNREVQPMNGRKASIAFGVCNTDS